MKQIIITGNTPRISEFKKHIVQYIKAKKLTISDYSSENSQEEVKDLKRRNEQFREANEELLRKCLDSITELEVTNKELKKMVDINKNLESQLVRESPEKAKGLNKKQ